MNVGSLFTGIGGCDLGFERAGMRVLWQSEIDPFATTVLRKHWPDVPNHGDIRGIRAGTVEPVDVLCGGFPCQDISVAGKGDGIDGERSGLWREYARLVRELRPLWVVAENVPALRTRGYDRVADDLEAAGYTVQAFVVGADDIGAPHRRKRVWIVAYATGRGLGELWSASGEAGHADGGNESRAVADADPQRRELKRGSRLLNGERPTQRDDADGCAGAIADAERDPIRDIAERGQGAAQAAERGHARPGNDGESRHASDAITSRLSIAERTQLPGQISDYQGRAVAKCDSPPSWDTWPPFPPVCELDDGIPAGLVRHRRPALAALGNALIPQIAEAIGRAIMRVTETAP